MILVPNTNLLWTLISEENKLTYLHKIMKINFFTGFDSNILKETSLQN
jgi:hypothetical protein